MSAEEANQLYALQYERLNSMLCSIWPIVEDSNHPRHRQAITSAIKIIDQISRLAGLN